MKIRIKSEIVIDRVKFVIKIKGAANKAACAGNTRGYYFEYGKY